MFFIRNEVIELDDQKKYIILDITLLNSKVFYQIREVDSQTNNVLGEAKYITVINENSDLYVEEVHEEEKLSKLKTIFTS